MNEDEKEQLFFQLNGYQESDVQATQLLQKHSFLATYLFDGTTSALETMARNGWLKAVTLMLSLGASVDLPNGNFRPLRSAVSKGHKDVAQILLTHGADPNRERTLVCAIQAKAEPHDCIELVKLLVKHGARLNDLYAMFGDKKNARTALDFVSAGSPMHAFLRSIGAKTAKEVLAENPKAPISDE